jgi:hypothetical protein
MLKEMNGLKDFENRVQRRILNTDRRREKEAGGYYIMRRFIIIRIFNKYHYGDEEKISRAC